MERQRRAGLRRTIRRLAVSNGDLLLLALDPVRRHITHALKILLQRHELDDLRRADDEVEVCLHLREHLIWTQRHATAWLVVLAGDLEILLHCLCPLGLWTTHTAVGWKAHADAHVKASDPDGINFRALGQDGIKVIEALERLDLDHDGGLIVDALPDVAVLLRIHADICETRDEAEWWD